MSHFTNPWRFPDTPHAFPRFQSHEAAASWRCPGCCGPLDPATAADSGYPRERGQYQLRCPACSFSFYYDLCLP